MCSNLLFEKMKNKQTNKKIDKHIGAVFTYRFFQIGTFGITSLLMPILVDEIELGIYFVILNLVAAQLLFELGLTQAMLQVASHVRDFTSSSYIGLVIWLSKTYRMMAYKFLFFSIVFGASFLYFFLPIRYHYVILLWISIAITVAINLAVSFKFTLLEAQGKVSLAAYGRLTILAFSSLVTWTFLYYGFGLFAIAFGYCIISVVTLLWLNKNYLLNDIGGASTSDDTSYIDHVKKIQYKFAASYVGGYLSFNAVVPIVFAFVSPGDAGKVGLALALFSSVTLLSSSFVAAKNQEMAKMVSTGNFRNLNLIFRGNLALTFFTAIVLTLLIFFGIKSLDFLGFGFSEKLLNFNFLVMIAIASLANSLTYAFAIYVRSHKVEPFVVLSCFNAFATLVLVYLGSNFGAGWAAMGYCFLNIFVALPITFIIFFKYYKRNFRKYQSC